jgi:hypothetical protein
MMSNSLQRTDASNESVKVPVMSRFAPESLAQNQPHAGAEETGT